MLHKSVEQLKRKDTSNSIQNLTKTTSKSTQKKKPIIPPLDFSNLPRSTDSDREVKIAVNQNKNKDKGNNFDANINLSVSINAVNSTVTTNVNNMK